MEIIGGYYKGQRIVRCTFGQGNYINLVPTTDVDFNHLGSNTIDSTEYSIGNVITFRMMELLSDNNIPDNSVAFTQLVNLSPISSSTEDEIHGEDFAYAHIVSVVSFEEVSEHLFQVNDFAVANQITIQDCLGKHTVSTLTSDANVYATIVNEPTDVTFTSASIVTEEESAYLSLVQLVSIENESLADADVSASAIGYVQPVSSGTDIVSSNISGNIQSSDEAYAETFFVPMYLTFSSNDGEFTLATWNRTKNWDGQLFYSTDLSTWTEWSGTTTLSSVDGKLYMYGSGNTVITGFYVGKSFLLLGSNVSCSGDIRVLLNYLDVARGIDPVMGDYAFAGLFCDDYGRSPLISAPDLPSMNLSEGCYRSMLQGTLITRPPRLPATTLAAKCYCMMLRGTRITAGPDLPATTLADECYEEMLEDCAYLTEPSRMLATTLARSCCWAMYRNCTSLSTIFIPSITLLADNCFRAMYDECTNIKLSTTQTTEYSDVVRIPPVGTGTDASNALTDMFANTGGTFVGTPSINTIYYTSSTVVSQVISADEYNIVAQGIRTEDAGFELNILHSFDAPDLDPETGEPIGTYTTYHGDTIKIVSLGVLIVMQSWLNGQENGASIMYGNSSALIYASENFVVSENTYVTQSEKDVFDYYFRMLQ